jgi:carbamoyl-phosphate synthase large subunit
VLGGGPNRIGQGIEFDYCCVHACYALRELGFETIMVNCNPETVSTDYDTADRLYFEPLTVEDVLNIIDHERPEGVLVTFGGQTPLNLAKALHEAGVPLWGTAYEAIDLAEDRQRFNALMSQLNIAQPPGATALTREEAISAAERIGYPVLVRPSYVLGGRGMGLVFNTHELTEWVDQKIEWTGHPLLIDHFLDDAYEVDVDALCDGTHVTIGGILQHIEEAGIHSGDSACVLPPYKLSDAVMANIRETTRRIGLGLGVKGLFNIQYALKDDQLYVLEVNPRSSRTVPFISKATGHPLAAYAAKIAAGLTLADLGFTAEPPVNGVFVKEAVLPFQKFPGADAKLGPEMRSTGEVMGHASSFGHAFAKSQIAANMPLPTSGTIFISVTDSDKAEIVPIARQFSEMGFQLVATSGTAAALNAAGLTATVINKVREGSPHVIDALKGGDIQMMINTPRGDQAHQDGGLIRGAAYLYSVPILTTLSAAHASIEGIQSLLNKALRVRSLQAHYQQG